MINNPYNSDGMWLKGNLHTHTENSPCGHYPLEKVIDMYTSFKMKYDFLAITDHYVLTELDKFKNNEEIILFSGVEYKKRDLQTLGINISSYSDDKDELTNHQQLFKEVEAEGGINIICHPHAFEDDYWPFEKLTELENYTGIEIYNNNIKFDNKGRAVATDLWDKLLSSGKRVWGFANDDMHVFQRCGGAFNMVLSKEKSSHAIIGAIKNGSFYASSGIFLDSIAIKDSSIEIKLRHPNIPVEFAFIGDGGKVLKQYTGNEGSYEIQGNEKYVRAFMRREDGTMAWTQPFWIC
ncbi:hypothetical protein IAI10_16890 [Clostridium sp. 19966]|uniref:hypothetical protein n=1 Tax=Clostridium sp. 19966 TaxID=2768166 RepID=UPI0028E076AB|nr:hypothetical protein [Clostridium sp. 19966]MDT8718345.1 hypothetical protein [Clostridium sp. 19966]